MQDERNTVAALNNAEWCAAVWRSHGLPVEQAHGMWFCPRPTPQYYPNVVTVDAAADPVKQTGFISELARGNDTDFSVKDSFSCLDLSAAGFHKLFDARWLCLRPSTPAVVTGGLNWRRIGDEPGLAAWERAWRGADPDARRIFRAALLEDRRVGVLAGYDDMGKILAGGIAYDAAGAVGVTNIFGATRQFLDAVVAQFAPAEIVRYEHGRDLTLATDLGFTPLGGLRVWTRIG